MIHILSKLQKAGHRIIAVVGGATGMIGDPSGKKSERSFLEPEQVNYNVECLKKQLSKYLDFSDPNKGICVNNYDWWSTTNVPLKVNTAGVIPIIFSSSLMQFPIVIASFLGKDNGSGIGSEILRGLNQSNWCNPEQIKYSWGLVLYIVLTVFFAYFYTSITFNPLEIANNMKKSGGFIPGIRPGRPTVEYLTKILNYIIFVGACGLILVQIVPILFNGWLGAKVSFGGTSLIIIVSVILETLKQIDSMTLVRTYKGFLNS